ncbi:MAG TPA: chromosomal replication initiator protein DnaA, partial [Candidatus Gracilibacteria bacterium]|nr:chromosomal replication initiator protein DnaA [Candidatus Gracilibacteria bacterium]
QSQDKVPDILKRFVPEIKNLVFKVDSSLENDSLRTIDIFKHFSDKSKPKKLKNKLEVQLLDGITSKVLNPKYSLDNFITGSDNQMAHAAASAVATSPGNKYNPLFIYGGVGLGKTHLLQAIGNEIIKNDANKIIVYTTSENFTNEVVDAIQKRQMEKFRQKYRQVDVLMIDDIQFFAGKDRTQEEFFHTFNTLHDHNKQLIISSDRPPKELDGIEDRLRSRCEWGMTVDVKIPDFETRLAILYAKAKNYQALIPAKVFEFIAFNVNQSIRELEGILMQLVAIIELKQESPSLEQVAEIIKKLNKNAVLSEMNELNVVNDIGEVVNQVANYYQLIPSELIGNSRVKELMQPRQMAMYLAKHQLKQSLQKIGDFFGGRDHTSVMHGIKKIGRDLKTDPLLKRDLKILQEKMGF